MVEDEASGLLVEPEDADGMAKAILRLLEDRDRATVMGRGAWQRAGVFSWDAMVNKYEALYRGLAIARGRV